MKKAIVVLGLFLISSFVAEGQSLKQGNSRAHILGTYGLRWKTAGIGGGLEYFFVDNFSIMPSYIYLFPRVGKESNFSADLRYYVSEGPSQLYFTAGYSQSWENTQPDGAGTRRSYQGANVGVGAYIRLADWVGLSTEFKAQSQSRQEVGFRFGFAFPL